MEVLMHVINKEVTYIGSIYSVQIDPLYFEWNKLIPTLEEHFSDILGEIMNCDNQSYALLQGKGQSIPTYNEEFNTTFRHSHAWRPARPRFPQPRSKGQAQHHGSYFHCTPQTSSNHHHSVLIKNPTCSEACTFRDASSTSKGEPNNHYHLAQRRTLQSDCLIDNSPCSYQHQQVHNTNISLHNQERTPIEQLTPVVNEANLQASVMVEQPVI